MSEKYDAIVIGSGPNGLSAAIVLAQAGLSVLVLEAKNTIGGGMRSAELTLPGFVHDICSAVHPLGIGSPFFCSLPLTSHGLEWIHPSAPLAHPFDDGNIAILERSVDATCKTLGEDAIAYKRLMQPLVDSWHNIAADVLSPFHFPAHFLAMLRLGCLGIRSAMGLAKAQFKTKYAQGFFAGLAAHAMMPLDKYVTAGFGLILGILGHSVGWPIPRRGSQSIANALGSFFKSLGGEISVNTNVNSINELPKSRTIFFDTSPKQLLKIVGDRFPLGYRRQLERYRYGPGIFKMDWALNHPIPWKVTDCARAGTVHLGGTMEMIAKCEREVWEGKHPKNCFVLVAQPSLFDATRAPTGKHTAWAYCHVPNGSSFDMVEYIENQMERFAPGFRDCILSRSCMSALDLEKYNPNYVGGDINGGVEDIYQLFTRPAARLVPYSTPIKGFYICSASTPPGGGVHGMCGYHAAHASLKECF